MVLSLNYIQKYVLHMLRLLMDKVMSDAVTIEKR